MSTTLICVLGVVALILLLSYGTAVVRTLSVRVRAATGPRRVEEAAVPIDELLSLQEGGQELEALGFRRSAVVEEEVNVDGGGPPAPSLVYVGREGRSFAFLSMVSGPNRWQAFHVSFVSFSGDGQALETVAYMAHMMPLPISQHHLIDAATTSWQEQWQRHQKELSEHRSFVSTMLDVDAAIARLRALRKATFVGQVERGDYGARKASGGEGRYRFGLRWALHTVLRSSTGENNRLQAFAKAEKQAMKTAKERGVDPRSAQARARRDLTPELVAFRRRDGVEQNRSSGWQKKLLFFAVSLGLFAVAFGIQLSPTMVLTLIGVLFFHELGHAMAMRAFGYRDLQILFIPFLGAVAAGRKHDAKPMEEILVLLAGPVPGIVVGTLIVLAGWGENLEWLQHAAYMMLFLNYLNLLPIVPLDGGRVMNIVLFDRFPNFQLGFAALSAAGMALSGRALDDNILFGLGIALLVSAPTQLKQNQLLKAARRSLRAGDEADDLGAGFDEDGPLRTIYAELLKPKFDKWNSETRYQFARQLRDRLARPHAGWGVALAGLAVYGLCLTAPIGAISYGALTQMTAAMEEYEAEYEESVARWDASIEAAGSDAERAAALYAAGSEGFAVGHEEDAYGYLQRAAALLEGGDDPELEASTLLILGQIDPYWEELADEVVSPERSQEYLSRALALREQLHGPESAEVAEVLELLWIDPSTDPAAALQRQQRLVAAYEQGLADEPERLSQLIMALGEESRMHALLGDAATAEARLLRAVELASGDPAVSASDQEFALDRLTKFYFATQRYDQVAALLERRSALVEANGEELDYARYSLEGDHAWLAYWQGDYADARTWFESLYGLAEDDRIPILGSDLEYVPHLMSQAAAAAREGDRDAAVALLERVSSTVHEELEVSLTEYLEQLQPGYQLASVNGSGDELQRRQDEQARVLAPLLASL